MKNEGWWKELKKGKGRKEKIALKTGKKVLIIIALYKIGQDIWDNSTYLDLYKPWLAILRRNKKAEGKKCFGSTFQYCSVFPSILRHF